VTLRHEPLPIRWRHVLDDLLKVHNVDAAVPKRQRLRNVDEDIGPRIHIGRKPPVERVGSAAEIEDPSARLGEPTRYLPARKQRCGGAPERRGVSADEA
jgi:hypothetical protein